MCLRVSTCPCVVLGVPACRCVCPRVSVPHALPCTSLRCCACCLGLGAFLPVCRRVCGYLHVWCPRRTLIDQVDSPICAICHVSSWNVERKSKSLATCGKMLETFCMSAKLSKMVETFRIFGHTFENCLVHISITTSLPIFKILRQILHGCATSAP